MIEKYRVHEVAKDLGLQSKEVVDLLGKYFDTEKKSMTALNEQELSVILNHYTNENKVENFDEYFAEGARRKQEAKGQGKAPNTPPVPQTSVQPSAPKAQPAQNRPAAAQPAPAQNRPAAAAAPQGQRPAAPQASRPAQPAQNRPAQGQRPAQQVQNNSSNTVPNKPRQRAVTTVDMRAGSTQVEMEKYNEKYDNLASSKLGSRGDVAAQKQKLTQRSAARRGKPIIRYIPVWSSLRLHAMKPIGAIAVSQKQMPDCNRRRC